jgi:hypothetical protein
MKFFLIGTLVLFLCIQGHCGALGAVLTRDGRKLEGEIHFTNNALVVVSASGRTIVAATNIARAQLSTNVLAAQTKGSGNGLLGVYYNSTNFTGLTFTRLDATVDFRWPRWPSIGVPEENFTVRWSGYIQAPTTDAYTLHLATDDGGRLFLDDQLLADDWDHGGLAETNVTVNLKAGEQRKLTLEYLELTGPARAHLAWSTPSMPKAIVPQDRLYAASFADEHRGDASTLEGARGLLATYYNTPGFTSNSVTRIDREIDFHWNGRSPAAGIASNRFSVRWTGNVLVTNSGEYKFFVYCGASIRLFINDQLLSNPWIAPLQHTIPATLRIGERCELRLEMPVTNNTVPVRLSWSGPGFGKTLLTRDHLFPWITASREAPSGSGPTLPEGVILANGAMVAAPIRSATASTIRFGGLLSGQSLAVTRIARIHARPITSDVATAIPKARSGVLLKNRDFIDGDFGGIDNGRLKIESVLFGSRSFDFAKDVVVLVLRGAEPPPWRYSIAGRDGTFLYGNVLGIDSQRARMMEAPEIFLPSADVIEITHRE